MVAPRPEPIEEQLMQDHRVRRDQLLALQPVDDEYGGRRKIRLCQLHLDCVEALHRARVIVLVVADEQFLRHTFDATWLEGHSFDFVGHGGSPGCGLCEDEIGAQDGRCGQACRRSARGTDEIATVQVSSHDFLQRD
jgi:hypothetical protein